MSYLRFGVHPGVGPARAVYVRARAEHVLHRVFDDVLDGGEGGGVFAGLRLPPVILGAHVGYGQLEAGHEKPLGVG